MNTRSPVIWNDPAALGILAGAGLALALAGGAGAHLAGAGALALPAALLFGGVSVMLGLAALLARRAGATPPDPQHEALAALARQSEALPQAAVALAGAVTELAALREAQAQAASRATAELASLRKEWTAAHDEAAKRTTAELASLRTEWSTGHDAAAKRTTAELVSLREAWTATHGDAAQRTTAELASLRKEWVAGHDAAAKRATAELASLREAWVAAHGDAAQRTTAELASLREAWTAAHDEAARRTADTIRDAVVDAVHRNTEALRGAADEVGATIAGSVESAAAAVHEVVAPLVERAVEGVTATAADHLEQAGARDRERGERQGARWSELCETAQQAFEQTAARDRERDELLARVARELHADLSTTAGAIREHLEAGAEVERSQRERLDAYMQRLASTTAAIGAAADTQTERAAALEERLVALCASSLGDAAAALAAHAERFDESLAASVAIAHEAADALRAGGAEVSAVTEGFTAAIDRHREAAEKWLANLGAVEAAVDQAGEAAAATALEAQLGATQELFAQQLDFHRELFEQLRGLRAPPAPAARSDQADVRA